ncbi:hypothetical protein WJ75_08620 [Burkholderia ubonensis]|nr:hypothetical protein WJ75_08620 [Burkholderia ubonensis]
MRQLQAVVDNRHSDASPVEPARPRRRDIDIDAGNAAQTGSGITDLPGIDEMPLVAKQRIGNIGGFERATAGGVVAAAPGERASAKYESETVHEPRQDESRRLVVRL